MDIVPEFDQAETDFCICYNTGSTLFPSTVSQTPVSLETLALDDINRCRSAIF